MSRSRQLKLNDHNWLIIAREQALIKQKGRCLYCFTGLTRTTVTAEHRVPKKHGGLDRPENIDAACGECNYLKGSWFPNQYKSAIKNPPDCYDPFKKVRYQNQGAVRRLNLQADRAVKRILATVGIT